PIGPGYPSSWAFPLDPKRRVAAHWKKLSFEGLGTNLVFWSDGTPENFEVVEGSEGPLKVRWLRHGLKTGAVENLPILEYIAARAAGFNTPSNPKVEPVPDDEPECPGWRPPEIPSSIKKAREIVAKALKKNPEQLTVN